MLALPLNLRKIEARHVSVIAALFCLFTASPMAQEPVLSADWARQEFGTFDPVSFKGVGEGEVDLPTAVVEAGMFIAHFDYAGGQKDALIFTMDENRRFASLLGDTFLPIAGADDHGSFVGPLTKLWGPRPSTILAVSIADGPWTVNLAPLDQAPALPNEGTGWGIFLYDGPKAELEIIGSGAEGGLSVRQVSPPFKGSVEVAKLAFKQETGAMTLGAGPSIVIIQHAGNWRVEGRENATQ
jgi:hypothetical protein